MEETKGQLVLNKITTAQAASMTLTDKQLWLSTDTSVYSVNNIQPDANGNVTLSIPTVNNATLTIQRNGTTVQTFTANASSDVTANITVPTNTNQLTNGAGFITSSALSGYATQTWVGQQGYLTSTALSGYATEQWVGQQGYITGITSSMVTTALGYTPYNGSVMTGADGTNAGTSGLVPAPAATDNTKYLRGDGTWQTVSGGDPLPSQTGNSGKFLTTNGTSASWADVPTEIPSQSGNSGKFLTTDGSAVSWGSALTSSDIVSSVSSSSDNTKAVGAKLFYDTCGDIETLINAL